MFVINVVLKLNCDAVFVELKLCQLLNCLLIDLQLTEQEVETILDKAMVTFRFMQEKMYLNVIISNTWQGDFLQIKVFLMTLKKI